MRRCAIPFTCSLPKCCSSGRSEEHTSELQSRRDLVCRLLLEKKKEATGGCVTPPQITPSPATDANGWSKLVGGWYRLEIIDTASRRRLHLFDCFTDPRLTPRRSWQTDGTGASAPPLHRG